jgi:FKBP-type peptidyl-prolyl cis-trans isomerase (trigger factor)
MLDRAAEYYRRQGLPDAAWEKNLPQWREKYRQESERNVRTSYILNAVGKDEKIEVTDADLNGELEALKKANPGKEADVEKYFAERRNDIAPRIREEKIFKFLLDNAKIKEEKK